MIKERHSVPDFNELVTHLKTLTNALNAVHGDLYWLVMQTPDASAKNSAPAADLNVDMLTELKAAVDDMRLLLWQYIETASQVRPQMVRDGMESQRLQRVTKFLQLLRNRLGPTVDEEPVSFIERINASVKERLKEEKIA